MADYDITAAFEAIENELIDSMMKNFARHRAEENKEGYLWSQWQAEQLKSLEQYRRQNEKKFTARFSQLNGKVADMLRRARADGSAAQEADILQAIQSGFKGYAKTTPNAPSATFFKLNDRKLDALIKATADDLKSAETAILRMSNDRYRKAIFNAQVYANTGAATYEKAVDMACRDMLRAGLNCVEYKNGARHTLSDYAHMAIRTANKRAYLYGEGQKRQQWGISTVVVNGRRGGCPLCTPYIGRVFVRSARPTSAGCLSTTCTAAENVTFHPVKPIRCCLRQLRAACFIPTARTAPPPTTRESPLYSLSPRKNRRKWSAANSWKQRKAITKTRRKRTAESQSTALTRTIKEPIPTVRRPLNKRRRTRKKRLQIRKIVV